MTVSVNNIIDLIHGNNMKSNKSNTCSFCGGVIPETMFAISGRENSLICANCVNLASQIISSRNSPNVEKSDVDNMGKLPSPAKIKEHLDKYVIGQRMLRKPLQLLYITITRDFSIMLLETRMMLNWKNPMY